MRSKNVKTKLAVSLSLLGVALVLITFKNRLLSYTVTNNVQPVAQALLGSADIAINGTRAWDITIHNTGVYARALTQGSLGLGEAYMDGWWDCKALDQFFDKLLQIDVMEFYSRQKWPILKEYIRAKLANLQSRARAFEVGEQHYDLGNKLFEQMLDKRLVYSCAYWKNARTLDEAQEAKLKLVCDKLNLRPGMQVLDIGCGWGSFAKYAAENYGVHVTGITVSREQAHYAQNSCKNLPVTLLVQDYRDTTGLFDRIVSIGMFEHVGVQNYKVFMQTLARLLKPDGLVLLHTIGSNISTVAADPWITKYIFPNGMLPSIKQIGESLEKLFIVEDWHNFGADYDKTLMAWFNNFDKNWHKLSSDYDERFYRMWKYYLLSCAGLFRARQAQLWQLVLSKNGVRGGYTSIR